VALIMAILGFIVGGAVFYIWGITKQRNDAVNLEAARAQAEEITKEAQTRSQLVVKEAELKAKDMVVGAKADAEREMRDRRREIAAIEQKLEAREETFEKRQEAFERREADLNRRDQSLRTREKSLTDKEELLQGHIDEARTKLEAVAGLTREEAKRSLMDEMIGSARTDAAKHIRIVEEEAREEADRRAKRVVAIAIERGILEVSTISSDFLGIQPYLVGSPTVYASRLLAFGKGDRCLVGPRGSRRSVAAHPEAAS